MNEPALTIKNGLQEARWWEYDERGKILCTLCPRFCHINTGQVGFCYIRKNIDNKLYTLGYGHPTGFAVDPIEKKPLNHFLPGAPILSFGTAGCNLGCKFCQNWSISKAKLDQVRSLSMSPDDVVNLAVKNDCPSIAYTYNDPTIFAEYVIDISRNARKRGIKNVMVTAGYITTSAREEVYEFIDAANVDLKAFSENFYHKLTFSHLQPVLDTLLWLRHETDIWFEITNLIIPGENDSLEEIREMCVWIHENLGDEVPLHFTAFHPDFKLRDKPRTPAAILDHARAMALEIGLKYVYVGNVHNPAGQTTYCLSCGIELIRRDWHSVLVNLVGKGFCPECGAKIAGRFSPHESRDSRGRLHQS